MYEKELEYVTNYLIEHNGEDSPRDAETFRKRSEHVKRVYNWAFKIYQEMEDSDKERINLEVVSLACLFHDIGYGSESYKNSHPIEGSIIWEEYAKDKYSPSVVNEVKFLIFNHANKDLLKYEDTNYNLILLIESDMLDEEGAMSIVWDSMVEGKLNPKSYKEVLDRIKTYSAHILRSNPLRTKVGRFYWKEKQKLVGKFIKALEQDLFI